MTYKSIMKCHSSRKDAEVRFKFQLCLIRGILQFFAGKILREYTENCNDIFDVLMPPTDKVDNLYSISNHSHAHTHTSL